MRHSLILLLLSGPLLWSLAPVGTADAHEIVTIGDYWLELGWLSEPALVGEKNAVLIVAANAETSAMVEDISTITVSIAVGGRSQVLMLRPAAEATPGEFAADIIPTVRGVYTLELRGTLGDERVNVDVELDEVHEAGSVQFPERSASMLELEKRLAASEAALGETRLVAMIALILGGLSLLASAILIGTRARSRRA